MPTPTYDIDLLRPGTMTADVIGSVIEGGRSLSGITGSIDASGGGLVRIQYSRIMLGTPQEHRYWNKLAGYLRGGVNKIYVPLLNDVAFPYPGDIYANRPQTAGPYWVGPPFFGDDRTRYQQWFLANLAGDFPLNAGTIAINATDLRTPSIHQQLNPLELMGGEWFSIDHGGDINHRIYRITEIDSATEAASGGATEFVVGIAPPLRAATSDGAELQFWRPLGTMGVPPDETMPWIPNAGWFGEHTINLIEKF